jgi:hypothetical protein
MHFPFLGTYPSLQLQPPPATDELAGHLLMIFAWSMLWHSLFALLQKVPKGLCAVQLYCPGGCSVDTTPTAEYPVDTNWHASTGESLSMHCPFSSPHPPPLLNPPQ